MRACTCACVRAHVRTWRGAYDQHNVLYARSVMPDKSIWMRHYICTIHHSNETIYLGMSREYTINGKHTYQYHISVICNAAETLCRGRECDAIEGGI